MGPPDVGGRRHHSRRSNPTRFDRLAGIFAPTAGLTPIPNPGDGNGPASAPAAVGYHGPVTRSESRLLDDGLFIIRELRPGQPPTVRLPRLQSLECLGLLDVPADRSILRRLRY